MRTAASSSMGGRKIYRNRSAGSMPSQMASALPSRPVLKANEIDCAAAPVEQRIASVTGLIHDSPQLMLCCRFDLYNLVHKYRCYLRA